MKIPFWLDHFLGIRLQMTDDRRQMTNENRQKSEISSFPSSSDL